MIDSLIDKQDNFEVIRDKIALILANESASQQALAVLAGKDPNLWKFAVYTERSNVWEQWLNVDTYLFPVVNIWFDNSTFDKSKSNVSERQWSDSTYNIDCLGFGLSKTDGGTGQVLGDELATKEMQRLFKLVRNILMSSEYVYLEMQGTVGGRWPQSIQSYQPNQESGTLQRVSGGRVALGVGFNEFSPQYTAVNLDGVEIEIQRASDGRVLAEVEIDY